MDCSGKNNDHLVGHLHRNHTLLVDVDFDKTKQLVIIATF